jgi:outer membrane protein OmpA-like peptidoglycan-associated protein
MKKNKTLLLQLLFLFSALNVMAQKLKTVNPQYNGLRINVAAIYDKPIINTTNKYLEYENAFAPSIAINHYWNKWGAGLDVDLIQHQTNNLYPTSNVLNFANVPVTNFNLAQQNLSRTLFAVGPNFQIAPAFKKWSIELQGRIGMGIVKGGSVSLIDNTTPRLVNFYNGFNEKHIISAKASIKGNYLIAKKLAATAGIYYIYQHNAVEQINSGMGLSSIYQPFSIVGANVKYSGASVPSFTANTTNVKSLGAQVGLAYLFNKAIATPKKTKQAKNTITIIAKDKISGVIMPNTTVTIKNDNDEIYKTAITDANGKAYFTDMQPNNYTIIANVANQEFEPIALTLAEMKNAKLIEKDIWYNDPNFVINGTILQCNTTKALADTKVVLNSDDGTINVETITNYEGNYQLQVLKNKTYNLYGQKNNFFSQVVALNPNDFDRKKSVFIQLEICGEIVDCKNAIQLNNILFDLAKAELNVNAQKELDKLVRFMTDNPLVKVELSSHTDSRGAVEANQLLSQKRADVSVAYIVSKGILQNRIIAKGYGESKLINNCADGATCSEGEHAKNRRTEIKLLCE